MAEFSFYHLVRSSLEAVLPRILERVRGLDLKAVVVAATPERVESLTDALWRYDQDSFLAHGSAVDGHAADQPIWLTHVDENPNDAQVVVLCEGMEVVRPERFQRCIEIFDGRSEPAVAAARLRYKQALDAGHSLKYFRQTETGWELAASREAPV
jgi:DNA polymerase-3 subunit chi